MRGQTVNVWNSQTGNLLPADFRASPYSYFAALPYFMRRTFTPHSSLDSEVDLHASDLENAKLGKHWLNRCSIWFLHFHAKRAIGDANSELFKEGYDEALHENAYQIWLCDLISVSLGTWMLLWGIGPYIFAAKPPPSFLIPHSSFLIPHLSRAFICTQEAARLSGLPSQ